MEIRVQNSTEKFGGKTPPTPSRRGGFFVADLIPYNDKDLQYKSSFISHFNKLDRLFNAKSKDDFIAVGILGKGYATSTNKNYEKSIDHGLRVIDYKSPIQWVIGDFEQMVDCWVEQGLDPATILNRMSAFNTLCRNIHELAPWWPNPFDDADEKLKRKLFPSKKMSGTKSALTQEEVLGIQEMLNNV